MSFPASPPHYHAWPLTRARWEGLPWVRGAIGFRSSGGPADHTHQVKALKQVCHHHQTSESSDVVSNQSPYCARLYLVPLLWAALSRSPTVGGSISSPSCGRFNIVPLTAGGSFSSPSCGRLYIVPLTVVGSISSPSCGRLYLVPLTAGSSFLSPYCGRLYLNSLLRAATPTMCNHSYRCAITIRHRNRALSFPTTRPHCDAWLRTRARWEGFPWAHGAVGTPSSRVPAGHTHHVQSVIRVRHHHKTSESSDVFSNQSPTL